MKVGDVEILPPVVLARQAIVTPSGAVRTLPDTAITMLEPEKDILYLICIDLQSSPRQLPIPNFP